MTRILCFIIAILQSQRNILTDERLGLDEAALAFPDNGILVCMMEMTYHTAGFVGTSNVYFIFIHH